MPPQAPERIERLAIRRLRWLFADPEEDRDREDGKSEREEPESGRVAGVEYLEGQEPEAEADERAQIADPDSEPGGAGPLWPVAHRRKQRVVDGRSGVDSDQADSEQHERDSGGEGGKPGRGQDGDGGRHAEGGKSPGGSIGSEADPRRQHHHRCSRVASVMASAESGSPESCSHDGM